MKIERVLGLSVFSFPLVFLTAELEQPPSQVGRAQVSSALVPASCPVTLPPDPGFTPPSPYPPQAPYSAFWYGTEGLWTMLNPNGTWHGIPPAQGYRRGYRDKVFWWRTGFDGRTEPRPELTVVGRRLDADASTFTESCATNAHHPDFGGWAMLTGIDIATTGCWELTGRYRNETLTFVVWVVP